jgi:hypothetical protein
MPVGFLQSPTVRDASSPVHFRNWKRRVARQGGIREEMDMSGTFARGTKRGLGRLGILPSKRRRKLVAAGAALALVPAFGVIFANTTSYADNASGCDFAATGTTQSCLPPLAGSTFAGADGNLRTSPTTFGTTDWQNAPNLLTGPDEARTQTDNSFGQGTKEDNSAVTVVDGSIPPNKSDITRFYTAHETINKVPYLYLAWERTNVLGSANFDFEINQKATACLAPGQAGACTINRTVNDSLLTFDFTNGGGKPTLGLRKWTGSQWGAPAVLDGTESESAVNNLDPVVDPYLGNSIPALTFGEAAVNLRLAGIVPEGACTTIGSVFLKSRSSASFTSEIKDFASPVPVNIQTCGTVNIIKHTDPRDLNQNFNYASTIPNPATGSSTPTCTSDTSPSSFTLNDGSATTPDTESCANVPEGSYTVTETQAANFSLESLTCTTSGTGGSTGSQDGTNPLKVNITLVAGDTVTCTYVNKGPAAILVTKTAKNHALGAGDHPLAGATFSVNGVEHTTDANGQACFNDLVPGTQYTVTETAAPTGYSIDTASKLVTPSVPGSCGVGGGGTPALVSFTDTPLTDISATATAQVGGGVISSTINCVDSSNVSVGSAGPGDPVTATATGVKPGTYTCTIVVDP